MYSEKEASHPMHDMAQQEMEVHTRDLLFLTSIHRHSRLYIQVFIIEFTVLFRNVSYIIIYSKIMMCLEPIRNVSYFIIYSTIMICLKRIRGVY